MDPLDTWRTAKLLIDQHGPDAAGWAAQRVLELHALADQAGEALWLAVVDAIVELQRNVLRADEAMH